MDKEVREKIARIIASTHSTFDERWAPATADEFYNEADEVLKALEELGYRKLEGELPLASVSPQGKKGAQAQRDSDIKWIRG